MPVTLAVKLLGNETSIFFTKIIYSSSSLVMVGSSRILLNKFLYQYQHQSRWY